MFVLVGSWGGSRHPTCRCITGIVRSVQASIRSGQPGPMGSEGLALGSDVCGGCQRRIGLRGPGRWKAPFGEPEPTRNPGKSSNRPSRRLAWQAGWESQLERGSRASRKRSHQQGDRAPVTSRPSGTLLAHGEPHGKRNAVLRGRKRERFSQYSRGDCDPRPLRASPTKLRSAVRDNATGRTATFVQHSGSLLAGRPKWSEGAALPAAQGSCQRAAGQAAARECITHSCPQPRCSGHRAQSRTRRASLPSACVRTACQPSMVTRVGVLVAGQVTWRDCRDMRQIGHSANTTGSNNARTI